MRVVVLLVLVVFTNEISSKESSFNGISYMVPPGLYSLELFKSTTFEEMKDDYKKRGKILINVCFDDPKEIDQGANITLFELEKIESTDEEYLRKLAEKIKKHNAGEYSYYDWNTFKRLDIVSLKRSFLIKTEIGRQVLIQANYESDELPILMEQYIKSITIENPNKDVNVESATKTPLELH